MTYPVSFSRNQRNIIEQRSKILNADNSSSNILDLENNLKFEKEKVNQQSTKPIQIIKQVEEVFKRRKKCLLVSDKKRKKNKKEYDLYDSAANISRIAATDDLVEGNYHSSSNQLKAVGFFGIDIGALSMSSNLQGETIPMAYSSSDIPTIGNKNKERSKYAIADNSSSNFLDLENNLKLEETKVNRTFSKPCQNTTQEEILSTKKVKKKYKCEFNKYPIRSKKKFNQEESIQSINQINASEVFDINSYNNAPPIEVSSTDVRSSIRRGETILMVWRCFFSLFRNVFSNLSSQFWKRSRQLFSDGFESEKEYPTSREV
jgi:recombinational DNA repair protein RecR